MKKVISILLTMAMLVSVLCSVGIVNAEDSLTTPYGTISEEFADAQAYPFVLFKTENDFFTGYANFKDAMSDARYFDGCIVLMRRDYTDSSTNYSNYAYHNTVNIDLGGFTFNSTSSNASPFQFYNKGTVASPVTHVKNGAIYVKSRSIMTINESSPKSNVTFEVSFTDCTLGYGSGASVDTLLFDYGASFSKTLALDATFTNCTFDMTNAPAEALIFNVGKASGNCNTFVSVNGGLIDASSTSSLIKVKSVNDANSGIMFDVDSNDNYIKYKAAKGTTLTADNYTLATGENSAFSIVESECTETEDIYTLGYAAPIATPYGYIPADFASVDDYPFVLFKSNQEFVNAYSNFKSTMEESRYFDGCAVLMRRDITDSSTNYSNYVYHTAMTVDLGGFTYNATSSTASLFQLYNKGTVATPDFTIKNGTINVKGRSLITFNQSSPKSDVLFNVDFVDVTIGYASGATVDTMVFDYGSTYNKDLNAEISFTDCKFDLTNAPATATLWKVGSTTSGDYNCNVILSVNGCEVTGVKNADFTLVTIENAKSSVAYSKGSGDFYLTYTASKELEAPDTTFVTEDGNLKFVLYAIENGFKTYYVMNREPLTTPYGDIPFKYESVTDYPIVMFDAEGNFVDATNEWGGNTGTGMLGTARYYDGLTAYFRADYKMGNTNSRDGYVNLGHHSNITNNIDLGGHIFDASTSNYYMFNFSTRDKEANAVFGMNVKNGTIKVGKNPVARFTYAGSKAQEYTLNYSFDDVKFELVSGAVLGELFEFDTTTAEDRFLDINLDLEDCTYALGANAPESGIILFNSGDANGNTTVTVNVIGGTITADDYANVKLTMLNNEASIVNFEQGENDCLLTATVAAAKDVTHEPVLKNNKTYAFAERKVSDGIATYTLAETDDYEMWLKGASVEVYNIKGACKLYLASYLNNEVQTVKIIDVTENAEYDIPAEFSGYSTLKAFLWDGDIAPLCVAQWSVSE